LGPDSEPGSRKTEIAPQKGKKLVSSWIFSLELGNLACRSRKRNQKYAAFFQTKVGFFSG
jgi:hypothetical protein